MAILSFFHNAFVFIFVITMATKQRLVNVELRFVEILMLNCDFVNRPRMSVKKKSLAGNLTSWQSTGGVNSTPTALTFFSNAHVVSVLVPRLLSQLSRLQPHCHALTPRIRVAQGAHLFVSCPKTVALHRAVSYVTALLTTPSMCTLS